MQEELLWVAFYLNQIDKSLYIIWNHILIYFNLNIIRISFIARLLNLCSTVLAENEGFG